MATGSLSGYQVRKAHRSDADQIFGLAKGFATSFQPERGAFDASFRHLIAAHHARLIVVDDHGKLIGYLLGFNHDTFFANGRVAWVEEIVVEERRRRQGIGRTLMEDFERWAMQAGCRLVALATRRAADFYHALGYNESATYFRKVID